MSGRPVGTFCLVLHSHLPWVAHAGAWPVGEEWLHQAWSASYLPLVELLTGLAEEGRRDVLTLGVTPVLAAMLDDPYCLAELGTWVAGWQRRAEGALVAGLPTAGYEGTLATRALAQVEGRWRHGASPLLRPLADAGVVELLGGPAAHPFQPLLPERVVRAQLAVGLDDAALRLGRRPVGIWAPECAYRPGLEEVYAAGGVGHFVVDGPTVRGRTGAACDVAGSGVVAFARDLGVTYRVWSPRAGYPAGRWYRDFHTFDHDMGDHDGAEHGFGLKPARVTSTRTAPRDKRPYDPARARAAVRADAEDFVGVVRRRLLDLAAARDGRPGLVVVAYDSELFGHWWHEGPAFLSAVLRRLPEAGVRVTTLRGAVAAGHVEGARELPAGSWGSGKDWRVWQDAPDLVALNDEVADRLLRVVDKRTRSEQRCDALDQLAREAFLATASDWAFCVSHGTAAGYARSRARTHARRFGALAGALEEWDDARAARLAAGWRAVDGPFGHLDARVLACGS
ncbi:MAG TPA: 1,4-alpha-glucan branching protein domain-containing protein [Frankiaceae bacterium]|nr:1,4-alpha-glucan branching protein domain-containing protein [Frankiaceae bacterium]